MSPQDLVSMKSRIDMLRTLYAVLFGSSLAMLVMQWTIPGLGVAVSIMWALTLGGAVGTRLYRSSLVNKYNAAIAPPDRPPPLQ